MFSAYTTLLNVSNTSMETTTTTGLNGSQPTFDPDSSSTYVVMRRFQTVLIPIICLIGIIGNVLAATVLLSPTLRRASCCVYLAGKSLSDIGFLVSLFVMWLYRIHVPLLNTQGVCQITVFLSYVCGFSSVWFVVAITFESFIRIQKPWRIAAFCSQKKAVIFIAAIVVFACSLYSFSLWSIGIIPDHNPECQSFDKYRNVALAMTYVDTSLTLLLPTILMVILIVAITLSVIQAYRRKIRLLGQGNTGNGHACTPAEGKVSRFLYAVSVIFLVLHAPSHVVRMRMMIMSYVQHHMPSITDLVIQRLFETFFYCNFALNCAIYQIGDNFKRVFREMYLCRCERKNMTAGFKLESPNTSFLLMKT